MIWTQFDEASDPSLGTLRFYQTGPGEFGYSLDGVHRPAISAMRFEDDFLIFPQIDKCGKLPQKNRRKLITKLGNLAVLSGVGVVFVEARGYGTCIVHLAGDGLMQYSVDGEPRPPFGKMEFYDDDNDSDDNDLATKTMIRFPDIDKTAQLPEDGREDIIRTLKSLASKSGVQITGLAGQTSQDVDEDSPGSSGSGSSLKVRFADAQKEIEELQVRLRGLKEFPAELSTLSVAGLHDLEAGVLAYLDAIHQRRSELLQCKVCFDRLLSVTLLPCRHRVLCESCADSLNACPVCRVNIRERIKEIV